MPFIQSAQPVIAQNLLDSILAALMVNPAAALLTTPEVHLFTAGPTPILPTQVPGDFTEATFVGYASVVIAALPGPINLPSTLGRGRHQNIDFLGGAVVAPGEQILGYWVDDGAAAFYWGEIFPAPIPIVNPGDFISLDFVAALQFINRVQ